MSLTSHTFPHVNALRSLLHSHTHPRLPRNPSPHLWTLPCRVTFTVGVRLLALPPVPALHRRELSSSLLGPASSPSGRHPSCPALALTPRVRLPSSGNTLVTFLGFWLHLQVTLFTLLMFQLSVPVMPGLLVPVGLLCNIDALLRGHPPHCASACTPYARLGLHGDVLDGLLHSLPIHIGSLTLLRFCHCGVAGCLSIEMPSSTHVGTSCQAPLLWMLFSPSLGSSTTWLADTSPGVPVFFAPDRLWGSAWAILTPLPEVDVYFAWSHLTYLKEKKKMKKLKLNHN